MRMWNLVKIFCISGELFFIDFVTFVNFIFSKQMKLLKHYPPAGNSPDYRWAVTPSTFQGNKTKPEKYGNDIQRRKGSHQGWGDIKCLVFDSPKKTSNWMVISGSGDGNMADNIEIAGQFLPPDGMLLCMITAVMVQAVSLRLMWYLHLSTVLNDLNAMLDYLRKSRAIMKFDLYGQNIGAGISLGVGANRPETRKLLLMVHGQDLKSWRKIQREKIKGSDYSIYFDKNYEPMYVCDRTRTSLKGDAHRFSSGWNVESERYEVTSNVCLRPCGERQSIECWKFQHRQERVFWKRNKFLNQ